MANLKARVGEKEAATIRKRLLVWAKGTNPCCADCQRANPSWASVNIGVLVCLECAGKHRSLGTHISKMRSITLDTILPEEARFLLHMSNELANTWWEARLDADSPHRAQSTFIKLKYTERRWALEDSAVPAPDRENVPGTHPWWHGAASVTMAGSSAEPTRPSHVVNGSVAGAAAALAACSVGQRPSQPADRQDLAGESEADLIDFGDFSGHDSAATAPAESDPFMAAREGGQAGERPLGAAPAACDPFSLDALAPLSTTHGEPASEVGAQVSAARDPFTCTVAAPSFGPYEKSAHMTSKHASSLSATHLAQQPEQATPQRPRMAAGVPSPHTSASAPNFASAQSGPAAVGRQPPAGVAAQSAEDRAKAERNARILSLYNAPPSPAPVPGMPSTSAPWAAGAHQRAQSGPEWDVRSRSRG